MAIELIQETRGGGTGLFAQAWTGTRQNRQWRRCWYPGDQTGDQLRRAKGNQLSKQFPHVKSKLLKVKKKRLEKNIVGYAQNGRMNLVQERAEIIDREKRRCAVVCAGNTPVS
jgi:hypothetical protein